MIKLVYRNDGGKLEIPKEVLPANGVPFAHHFQSTDGDNLIELAGRVCYDSAASEKTRATPEYHKHINEVNHGSVQEHLNLVAQIRCSDQEESDIIKCLVNRPGISVKISVDKAYKFIRICYNIRVINDWDSFNKYSLSNAIINNKLKNTLGALAKEKCPLAISTEIGNEVYQANLVKPFYENEIWLSFYISGVSRGLTHELIRHKYHTAVSQRSTRYVDESESDWAWHPLIEKYKGNIIGWDDDYSQSIDSCRSSIIANAKLSYAKIMESLQNSLIKDGLDKFGAKKISRGAARGILGNALSTELIFSASVDQWKRICHQRCNNAADSEIRIMCSNVFDSLCDCGYLRRDDYLIEPAQDSFGYHIKCLH